MPAGRNGGPPVVTDDVRIEIDGTGRRFGSIEVVPLVVYHVPDLSPKVLGPWQGEADKIAWTDPTTGMSCILRRSAHGHLCGYVAVEPEHPLYGVEADALPRDPELIAHGGVSYARACEHLRPIARSVWRKPPTPDAPPAWWFGFECNHGFDEATGGALRVAEAATGPSVYRDEAYVYRGCVHLAAQLDAVAKGLPMPGPPPISDVGDDR